MSAEILSIKDVDSIKDIAPQGPAAPVVRKARSNSRATSLVQQIYQCIAVAALAVASYFLISHYVLQSVQVSGLSMWPTLHDSDRYFLNRLTYHFRAPQRGEIVVVRDPSDGSYCVKRIVGLPGESLYFKNGDLFVNGKELDEPYLNPGTKTFTPEAVQQELVACGKDSYYVMGDNRNFSYDSRYYGPISRQNILGLVMR